MSGHVLHFIPANFLKMALKAKQKLKLLNFFLQSYRAFQVFNFGKINVYFFI